MTPQQKQQLRDLPSVDRLLASDALIHAVDTFGHALVVESSRATIDDLRQRILQGSKGLALEAETVCQDVIARLQELIAPTLQPVINATGVIVHTNLGRAPLSEKALAAITAIGRGYSNLEYDLPAGARGSRSVHAAGLIGRITQAESATVVNNAASAVLLMLSALCVGKEVIVSRGQLVEIGGGFRMPDVMRQAGVTLIEVGTTNRTHLRDYANAITENTAAILSIHHSNYKIVGFTSEPALNEIADLAHEHGLPFLYDQGSGALIDTAQFGLEREPLVQESVAAGCDVVAFSGDKLIGGPQAGIIAGRSELIATIKRHPLARAVRPDKMAYAGLGATLTSYITGRAVEEVPVWHMMSRTVAQLAETAVGWQAELSKVSIDCAVIDGLSTVGGGSLPGQAVATKLLALIHDKPDALAARLRKLDVAVIGRIQNNQLVFDPRTVLPHQEATLLSALKTILK